MSGIDDDIDQDIMPDSDDDDLLRSLSGSRNVLDDDGPDSEDERAPGVFSGYGSDEEAPAWLTSGSRPDGAAWPAGAGENVVQPEEYTFSGPGDTAPSWIEIDDSLDGDEEEDEPGGVYQSGPVSEQQGAEDTADAMRRLKVVHESRRTRNILIIVAAVAACVCIVSTYMFTRGLGPFTPVIPPPPDEQTSTPVEDPGTVAWATAGEGYKDLFALISEQIQGANTSPGGAATGDLIPSGPMDGGFSDAPVGETATAGSGYYTDLPQLPPDDPGSHGDTSAGAESGNGSSAAGSGAAGDVNPDANGQTAGVSEADMLKSDGQYIYAINSQNLIIVKADGGDMQVVSKIAQPPDVDGQVYFQMYVAGDRLIALRRGFNSIAQAAATGTSSGSTETSATCIDYPYGGYVTDTSIDIFDISNRQAPVRLHSLSQSGDYVSSQMIGGYLYLITTYYGDVTQMDGNDPRTFVPLYARDGEQFTPPESDIYLPLGSQWPSYTVIAGIDAMGDATFISQKSVYGDAGTIYASLGAVYLARTIWEDSEGPGGTLAPLPGDDGPGLEYVSNTNSSETLVSKLSLNAGKVEPRAQTQVPGYVMNQYSLDEYKGTLRLVTSVDNDVWYGFKDYSRTYSADDWARLPAGTSETANALYTLDDGLQPLGNIGEMAPGERVYSCRFMGDIAYFVTYRQTDPMFAVDLSDPSAPKTLGALKIAGFSEYLSPYANGRLFGLGRDADPNTGVRKGLKLTMFDNSDPADVKELHTLSLGGDYSAAEQNSKAILVSADKSLVAFPAAGKYLIYGYDDAAGFKKIAELKSDSSDSAGTALRGLFVGGTFYVVEPNDINAYAIDSGFSGVGSLPIDTGASTVSQWDSTPPATTGPTMPGDLAADDTMD